MPRILFVKTSSLGDVIHNCPAVSDVARKQPLNAMHADEAGGAGNQDSHCCSARRSSMSFAYFM